MELPRWAGEAHAVHAMGRQALREDQEIMFRSSRVARMTPCIALITLLCVPWHASALTPPKTGARSSGDAAVVIGIELYTDLPRVPYAERDANLFSALLVRTIGLWEDQVERLSGRQANREAIHAAVMKQGRRATETFWIYFSGHGAPSQTREALLLGRDAVPEHLERRGIRQAELIEWARSATRAKRIVIVLDACFLGTTRTGGSLTGGRFGGSSDLVTSVPQRVFVWASTDGNQTAWPLRKVEHGAFTYWAVGALAGWAADGGGSVKLQAAVANVKENMSMMQRRLGRSQTPISAGNLEDWTVTTVTSPPGPPDIDALLGGEQTNKATRVWPFVTGGLLVAAGGIAHAYNFSLQDEFRRTGDQATGRRLDASFYSGWAGYALGAALLGYGLINMSSDDRPSWAIAPGGIVGRF